MTVFTIANNGSICRLMVLRCSVSLLSKRLLAVRSFSTCNSKMGKTAVVLVAPGSEEMEFVISVDVLRRVGVAVTVAGLPDRGPIKCSRDVVIHPDKSFEEAIKSGPYDAVILPGGLGGSEAFCASADVGALLKEQESSGRLVAAICAAPTALKAHGIGFGKRITSYPSFKEELSSSFKYSDDQVVTDGNLITSRGPGTAFAFALAIGEHLVGNEKVNEVKKGLLLSH